MFCRTSLFAAVRILLAVAASLATATAEAQQGPQAKWPQRPVKVIVPYAAGGNTDGIARVTGQALGEMFGQSFAVENKVGGNGTVAAEFVARAPADGYTLFMVAQPVFAQRMGGLGVDLLGDTPEEFAATIRADIPLWAEAVRVSGAKVD